MKRESTKHGPARDEELKHESEVPESAEPEDLQAGEIALRSELARLLTRDEFPADRNTLLARLADTDASDALIAQVTGLSQDRRFASVHEVMVALGINAPESRPEGGDV